jgi:hypothetical protein
LKYPAEDFNICPSCGVEFGADTVDHTILELREAWFNRGMQWTSNVLPQPSNYSPAEQLSDLQERIYRKVAASSPEGELTQPDSYAPPKFRPINAMTTGRLELRRA